MARLPPHRRPFYIQPIGRRFAGHGKFKGIAGARQRRKKMFTGECGVAIACSGGSVGVRLGKVAGRWPLKAGGSRARQQGQVEGGEVAVTH